MSELNRTEWIWRNGAFIPWHEATVHVMSHVVHYGSSVFEGIRCYSTPAGPAVFRLADHMRRMEGSAAIYRMPLPHGAAALSAACCQLIARNELSDCYIRPIALRGYGPLGVNPLTAPVETYIACFPWGAYLGATALEQGVDVGVSSWVRPAPNTIPALAKAGGNYLNSQLIKMEALANGFDDGIALSGDGVISEGSGQNVFLVRAGVLYTPAIDGTLLAGITRDSVLVLARDLGIPVREERLPRELLYTADELFFTGTASEVTPIRSVDRIAVAGGTVGPITRRLQRQLLGVARGELPDTHDWLTPVHAAADVKVVA